MRLPRAFLPLLFALAVVAPASAQRLKIQFLDVGQGDAALVTTPERKFVLIDAGLTGDAVVAALRAARIDTLDLVVSSHNHADHIGGMSQVLSALPVRFYLENGLPEATATYRRTVETVNARRIPVLQATARTITAGNVRLNVLPLPAAENGGGIQNNSSLGIVIEFGSFRALFTGDSEAEEMAWWLERQVVPRVQVLKVAHHGSRNGTSAAWVAATSPLVAVVSVGARNQYGHPHPDALAGWAGAAARVYRTDQDGGITVEADSTGEFSVTTEAALPCRVTYLATRAARREDKSDVLCR